MLSGTVSDKIYVFCFSFNVVVRKNNIENQNFHTEKM